MSLTIEKNDCVELSFTGYANGTVFDSNIPEDLKQLNQEAKPQPLIFFVGQGMVVRGLDREIEGKEIGKQYTAHVLSKEAYGPRSSTLIKTIPLRVFLEKNVNPQPGMAFALDNTIAHIRAVSGARVIADLNHPLAGKDLDYKFTIVRKIEDKKEKSEIFFKLFLGNLPNIEVLENKVVVKASKAFEAFVNAVKEPFKTLVGSDLEFIESKENAPEKAEEKSNQAPEESAETIQQSL